MNFSAAMSRFLGGKIWYSNAVKSQGVFCYNVQLGAYSELEILSRMVEKYKKPVHLTFNSLYYLPEQYPEITEIIKQCMELGFRSYIIADPALLVYLKNRGISCEIHLSGRDRGSEQ